MKKLSLITLLLVFSFTSSASADYFLYRKNSGEVVSVSVNPYQLEQDSEFDQVQDPFEIDGFNLQPVKIWNGLLMRNATSQELDDFAVKRQEDERAKLKKSVKDDIDRFSQIGVQQLTLLELLFDEINILRQRAGLVERTKSQLVTAWKGKIDAYTGD